VTLNGSLTVPEGATVLVLFVHGSGSSRHSPRNQFVARQLNAAGLATLLFDLLTRDEEAVDVRTAQHRFDISLLAERLVHATRWAMQEPATHELRIGYFGSSTGGGAALVAAAELAHDTGAVVSRGGRPDLAGEALPRVQAPTLLIVGGEDDVVIDLNQHALAQMHCEAKLEIVPGATHLFEEPGALDHVAELAADWFVHHTAGKGRPI
jgi:putative phosphoribosyl transferase